MSGAPVARPLIDRAGVFASGLCAVHCATCALLPSLFVVLGLGALLSHEAEWGFTLIAVAVAVIALALGWRRHRSLLVAVLFAVGVSGLLASRFLEERAELAGTAVGVLAAAGLVAAHTLSLRRLSESRRAGNRRPEATAS